MLKIGVFGVGHLGKFHLNNWKQIPTVELVGFFDPNNEAAEEVEKAYGIKRFLNEADLIAVVDAIDVVTPTHLHFPVCEMAIKMGKHVFVEKPMANTIDMWKDLIQHLRH